jgi:FMN phosphatase YigB (HAD superfamily)
MTHSPLLWVQKHHIKLFLFDLDDTLIDTNTVFDDIENQVCQIIINSNTSLSPDTIIKKIKDLDYESYQLLHANFKKRWPYLTQLLANEFNLSSTAQAKVLQTFESLTSIVPELKIKVKETLQVIHQLPVKMGVVTQANKTWTLRKMNHHGLTPYFDHIFPIGGSTPKSASSWGKAISYFKVFPSETVVIGDSLTSDIIGSRNAGVSHIFWVKDETGWTHVHRGVVPKQVIEIKGIDELLNHLKI